MSKIKQHKIAIIGPADTVSGFRALGVVTFDAKDAAGALEQLRTIRAHNDDPTQAESYVVVCIIENLLTEVDTTEYKKLTSGALPAVVSLPGPEGATGFSINRLRALAEQAVGSSII